MNKKAVCLLSGGLDSGVAAHLIKEKGYELLPLFFEYGQSTFEKEKKCFEYLIDYFEVKKSKVIPLNFLKNMGGSGLTDKKIILRKDNRELEYVPFRNSVFLSIATAWAEVEGADIIVIGSTGGDTICPDNSPEYINSFQKVIDKGTMLHKEINLVAPLMKINKTEVVRLGIVTNFDFSLTWSCHNSNDLACGKCSNCEARLKAFKKNSIKDPLPYEEKE
jgi:7-cyano-7-deazaguanine synthase